MNPSTSISDPAVALSMLRVNPEALAWPDRLDLARSLSDHLRSESPDSRVEPLAEILAGDPKPEVRQAVARLLHLFEDGTLARLAVLLEDDSNAFVRKAAERSLARRLRGQRDAERARRSVRQVQTEYDAIARMHGEMAAERAQAMAERFADVVVGTTAHNLGGVITSLKLKSEALSRDLQAAQPDLVRVEATAHAIAERIAFLERLVRDMSEYSRPLSNERRRERLSGIVEEAHRLAVDALRVDREALASIACSIAVPEAITVEVVRYQILMALTNLLKNAYESLADRVGSSQTRQITVIAVARDDEIVIKVADTGAGLDARDLADLREFVPGRTSRKNRGTGYGLPIARRYVAAHGGA
ncbi:MAG: HAMP domain-containing histidine kinase, partial [Phycisphaerales bacterium]|nr:HAMP domain-containing histidine kinase [Phycisphaerales bacterium]